MYNGKPLSEATARDIRIERLRLLRSQNATARRLGFKNWQEWQGGEE